MCRKVHILCYSFYYVLVHTFVQSRPIFIYHMSLNDSRISLWNIHRLLTDLNHCDMVHLAISI